MPTAAQESLMGLRFSSAAIDAAFGEITPGLANRQLMLSDMARVTERYIRRPFARGTDPYGKPWAPLKRATDQRGLSGGQLVLTGALRGSFSGHVQTDSSLVFGVGSPDYASYHQHGTATIPRRQFVPDGTLPAQWEADLRAAIVKRLGGRP